MKAVLRKIHIYVFIWNTIYLLYLEKIVKSQKYLKQKYLSYGFFFETTKVHYTVYQYIYILFIDEREREKTLIGCLPYMPRLGIHPTT